MCTVSSNITVSVSVLSLLIAVYLKSEKILFILNMNGTDKTIVPSQDYHKCFSKWFNFWYHNLCKEGEDEMENKKEYRAREGNIK